MTNHTPTFTSSSASGSFTETANTMDSTALHLLSGTMNFTDADHSDTHTTSATLHSAVLSSGSVIPAASLTHFNSAMSSQILSDNNGSGSLKWSFSDADYDFDFLSKNQTLVLTYDVSVSDNHGGTVKQTVKVTITGTDDKPVISPAAVATVTEQANHTLSLSPDTVHVALQFTDDDLTNTGHTASVTGVTASGVTSGILPGSFGTAELMAFFNVDNVVKASGSSNGTINTTFSAPDLSFDYLAAGEQLNLTYTVQLDDHAGGISTQTVAVTVNGTNDKPTVLAFPESAHLTEDHNLSGGNLTAHGDFLFSDLDLSDTHTVSTAVTATRSGGGTVPIADADLIAAMGATIDPDSTSQLLGDVDWNFALPNSAVSFLGDGETLTLNYHITVTDSSGASDIEEVCITVLGTNHPVVTKIASVPGGTADTSGEVISYSISVANAGHTTLTGITVTDPSVSNLAPVLSSGFNAGDTNHDNKLSVGETWQYTASHTVTQTDLDTNGGGDGTIENTVTVGSDQALPVSATAAVVVVQHPTLQMTKTPDVTSVDAAGDVIHYSIAVKNIGTTTQNDLVVTDPQITHSTPVVDVTAPVPNLSAQLFVPLFNGDNNLGDDNNNGIVDPTDQNNARDPGETWQYVYLGDTSQDGFHDPGETWTAINLGDTNNNGVHNTGEIWVGDTNQNGIQEAGERWQFKNVWDTNHNGLQDGGEVWHYQNVGDQNQNGTQDSGETFQYYNIGDTNQNGFQDSGETFQFYNIGDTNHNGVQDSGETFQIDVDHNVDPVLSGGFNVGDSNQNGSLDIGETWQFTVSYTVTQGDIDNGGVVHPGLTHDNTSSATTDQGVSADATAHVQIVQNPHLSVTKTASIPDADHDGKIDSPADDITYTITVVNDGNMTLTGVNANDSIVGALTTHSDTGAGTHGDNILNVGETWTYTAVYNAQQSDIDNHGNVDGTADNNIHNTASVTAAPGASGSASADVPIDYRPHLTVTKTATIPDADHNGKIDNPADDISYTITVVNDGNVTLTGVNGNDSITGALTTHTETGGTGTNGDNILNVGETWTYTAVYNTQQSDIDNHGNVDGTADNNIHNTASFTTTQSAIGSASADVAIDYNPQVTLGKVGTWNDANHNGFADTGETIGYTFTETNTGNATLHNIGVTDTDGVTVTGSTIASLAPGASDNTSWSGNYTINSTDVSNGFHDNTATVTADEASASSGNDHVVLPQPPPAAPLTIDDNDHLSMFVDIGPTGPDAGGDLIQFFFKATNHTSNTLTSFTVSDTLGDIPGSLQNPVPSSLGPNGVYGTTFNHILTATDVANHFVDDDVTASGIDPSSVTQTATLHYDFLLSM